MDYIENRTYAEIQVGDSATPIRTPKPQGIQLVAIMSGDVNPAHVDSEYAKSSMFREVIAHDDEIHPFERAERLSHYFGSDAVAGQDGNFLYAHVLAPIVLWHLREAHAT